VERLEEVRELTAALREGGLDPTVEWVLTGTDLERALDRGPWDVVLAAPLLAQFNSYAALMAVRRRGLDLPFLVVSDGSEETIATNTMRAGADEYLLREDLRRLGAVVDRVLRENANHSTRRVAERALRRADELATRLDKVLDNSSNEIYFFDSISLHFIQANQGARRNLGYSQEELLPLTPLSLKPELTAEAFYALLDPLRTGERDQVLLQTTHRRRDGSTYPVESRIQFSRTEDPPIFVEIAQDITERKRAEERIHLRVEQLQAIHHLSEAVAKAETVAEVYERALDGLLRATKADRAALLIPDREGSLRFVVSHQLSLRFREALEGSALWAPGAAPAGPIVLPSVAPGQPEAIASACLREGVGSIVVLPLLAQTGVQGACLVAHDRPRDPDEIDLPLLQTLSSAIAMGLMRKWNEEALRRSEARYRSLVEGVRDYAIFALDSQGNVASWNAGAERILGYKAEEIVGQPLAALYSPEAIAQGKPAEGLQRAALLGSYEEDGWRLRRDGQRLWAHGHITALRDDEGNLLGYSKLLRDLTEKKRAEEELEASRRQLAISEKLTALGTLVSGVAHEIRTPLTYVKNNLNLLHLRLERMLKTPGQQVDPEELLSLSRAASEGADRINLLVKNLRQSARLDGGRRATWGLEHVVMEAVDLFEATQRGRVAVVTSFEPTPPLHLVREQIQQVILNLLLNAAEAMPRGGRVVVTTRWVAGGALVSVTDEGGGIPEEVQARLFDPFFTTKAEGTGLGLSISRRIVEAHGGEIRWTTRAGQGTTFSVFLPHAVAIADPEGAPPPSGP